MVGKLKGSLPAAMPHAYSEPKADCRHVSLGFPLASKT